MDYYDLHTSSLSTNGENTSEEMIEMGKKLGLKNIGIVNSNDSISCAYIEADNLNDLSKSIEKSRRNNLIVMVAGGNYEINRAACENSMVDILCHPETPKNNGLDHICTNLAAENNVAIEINLHSILECYKWDRVGKMKGIRKNIQLCKKSNAKIITTSGAKSKWGMRSGRDLVAFSNILGLDLGDAIKTSSEIPAEIINNNEKKMSNKMWRGVEEE